MKQYVLIVNPSGRLSACPTEEEFKRHNYLTDAPLRLFEVTMRDALHAHLWANRDNAVIYGPGLPSPACLPGSFYYQVRDGVLVGAPQSTPAAEAIACMGPLCRGVRTENEGDKTAILS